MHAIVRFWQSPTFERLTHRIGATLLLLANLALPLGLHRPFMRQPGFWLFPLTFVGTAVGSLNYLNSFNGWWLVLVWPYPLLITADMWAIWFMPVPASTSSTKPKA